ncbi:DISARM system phospholipase D-like protein DrmC [Kocuria rosea]|uniref:DISARM system phospholipase D-like protein DrmC n=1 Tax=Kocuria rosea TaxID=1275 RepID=UPI00117409E8|nr:DISARM system phospholipase D-like protein DrmC [Kocuria rosea]TQN38652.1 phospholipase D-like protein [Kocuria rosea]
MASSEISTAENAPAFDLGRFLTGTEAKEVADRLASGATITMALNAVAPGRREVASDLLRRSGLGAVDRERTVLVLRALHGARSTATAVEPRWTMPGHLAQSGALTGSVSRLVEHARTSITCSTFNFQRSSILWKALGDATKRTELTVRVYLDTGAADTEPHEWSPTTQEVADHLRPATVLRTRTFDGTLVRNHAKFLIIDHRFLLVTSANLSKSAEWNNVEFGVYLDNANLAEMVESEMREVEGFLYELVHGSDLNPNLQ